MEAWKWSTIKHSGDIKRLFNGEETKLAIGNPYQTYQQNQVNTASPGELTLMLYNGAVKFIKQAKQAISNNQMEQSNNYIVRVQEIVTELMVTLNMDYEISQQLMQLYDYMKRRLIEANLKKDTEILSEVEELILDLRQTWTEAMKLAKQRWNAANEQ